MLKGRGTIEGIVSIGLLLEDHSHGTTEPYNLAKGQGAQEGLINFLAVSTHVRLVP